MNKFEQGASLFNCSLVAFNLVGVFIIVHVTFDLLAIGLPCDLRLSILTGGCPYVVWTVHMFGGCGGVLGKGLCHWEGLLLPLTPISMWS